MALSRLTSICLFLVAASALVGCSGNVKVTGRVTYENGQPLTIGQVVFTDDFYMGKSDLDKNGEYSIHSMRRNDGLKKGVYRAFISSAYRFEKTEAIKDPLQDYRFDTPVLLVDMQFTNPDTTGWVFDLKKNSRIDFVVYPPGEVPEDKKTEAAKYMFDPEYRKKVDKERAMERMKEQKAPELPKKRRTVNPNLL